ncbi:unnamed protein product [Meganyctiphanes norvegica]|uniref:Mitochondrial splicing suppressor 51-like C-terminal domain-containing protein n=1 Tax=Meganyctiphanes norvegica TaxID=48144 RepID=A0AAV2RVX7_MEGNR
MWRKRDICLSLFLLVILYYLLIDLLPDKMAEGLVILFLIIYIIKYLRRPRSYEPSILQNNLIQTLIEREYSSPYRRDISICNASSNLKAIMPKQNKKPWKGNTHKRQKGSRKKVNQPQRYQGLKVPLWSLLLPSSYPTQYPQSLLYAIQKLPERRLGPDRIPLEELHTLTVHVVNSSPLFEEHWEMFLRLFPELKRLNMVFVMQGRPFMQPLNLITMVKMTVKRYYPMNSIKHKSIDYSIKQMHYHMYFSSEEYIEPDIVVVYGNTYEMSPSLSSGHQSDDIHSEISYRNMLHSYDTILILMDQTMELVKRGVKIVNAARPVEQLVAPMVNPLRGGSSNESPLNEHRGSEWDSEMADSKEIETYHFTCLRRQ